MSTTTEAGGQRRATPLLLRLEMDLLAGGRNPAYGEVKQIIAERDALKAECERLRGALDAARRDAYIRGYMRGSTAATDAGIEVDYEHRRALAEAHAISYSEQFDDAALASVQA